jgi:hypothetical protein
VPPQVTEPDPMEKVKVRNNSRRSLLVKVPGAALHLQPGASAEVPRAYLNGDELATLVRSGTVLVIAPPAATKEPAEATPGRQTKKPP